GGPDYGWVPLGEVGRVVAHEQDTTFSLPAGTIDALLTGQGYGDFTPVPYGVLLYKVRYTTQDRGDLIEVTGYAAFPDVREPQRLPMLLWTHPTVGFSDACAPTAIGLAGAALPVLLASQGYVVAAPDYIGMNGWGVGSDRPHPWAVAEPTALASLDMARATIALRDDLGLLASPDPGRIVAWGASQGGHAALFADRYAAGYAPDVAPMAVVATIPPTDLKALSVRGVTEFSQTTTGLAGALVAAARWYQAGADLGEVLQAPFDAVLPTAMDTLCEDFGQVATGVDEVSDVWQEDYVAALTAGDWDELDPWECYLEESSIVRSPVPYASAAAVLLVTGEDDDLAWAPSARADVQPMCDQGYTVQHVECAGADHVGAAVESLPLQLSWIEARLRGDPVEDACTTREPGP
ncbi:MAG: lipase family protein, partial [Myxococcota bacterium]|nr:lipase family protein [Myxococcota bacterium]